MTNQDSKLAVPYKLPLARSKILATASPRTSRYLGGETKTRNCRHSLVFYFVACLFSMVSAIGGQALAQTLSNSAQVPVLLYHSYDVGTAPGDCTDYSKNALLALGQDLEYMYQHGYTVVPLYWIAQWAVGIRDGSTLPAKAVGLSFDDGVDTDWIDNAIPGHPCAPLPSARSILSQFKSNHPDLPWYSPFGSFFVIASPVARLGIDNESFALQGYGTVGINNYMHDTWWADANSSGFSDVYNHSVDHDDGVSSQTWDPSLGIYLAVGGYADGNWAAQRNFSRINNYQSSSYEVVTAAQYISSITGTWPDLFVTPFGEISDYLQYTYFPAYGSEHNTLAAFCGDKSSRDETYVSRGSPRYCIGRFTWKDAWPANPGNPWSTDLGTILDGAAQ